MTAVRTFRVAPASGEARVFAHANAQQVSDDLLLEASIVELTLTAARYNICSLILSWLALEELCSTSGEVAE